MMDSISYTPLSIAQSRFAMQAGMPIQTVAAGMTVVK
jgi:hypothetical protein